MGLPMSIGCIISPADFGLGVTNGVMNSLAESIRCKNSWPWCGSRLGFYRYKGLTENWDAVCRQISAVDPYMSRWHLVAWIKVIIVLQRS